MIKKGLVVSVQYFNFHTTQELADICYECGAVGIRTDAPIKIKIPIIGLLKIPNKQYYITTSIEAIKIVSKWADYVAIDCRYGNKDLELLLSYCHVNNIKVVADIENISDYARVINICKSGIKFPEIIATTFSKTDNNLIKEIRKLHSAFIMAEGGYNDKNQIKEALDFGADCICIGEAITGVKLLTEKFVKIIKDNECFG